MSDRELRRLEQGAGTPEGALAYARALERAGRAAEGYEVLWARRGWGEVAAVLEETGAGPWSTGERLRALRCRAVGELPRVRWRREAPGPVEVLLASPLGLVVSDRRTYVSVHEVESGAERWSWWGDAERFGVCVHGPWLERVTGEERVVMRLTDGEEVARVAGGGVRVGDWIVRGEGGSEVVVWPDPREPWPEACVRVGLSVLGKVGLAGPGRLVFGVPSWRGESLVVGVETGEEELVEGALRHGDVWGWVRSQEGGVWHRAASGSEWSWAGGHHVLAVSERAVVLPRSMGSDEVVWLDRETGEELGEVAWPRHGGGRLRRFGLQHQPGLMVGEAIYAVGEGALVCVGLEGERWRVPLPGASAPLAAGAGVVFLVAVGTLVALEERG